MATNEFVKERVTPVSSPEDERQYRVITLKNGLRALLISDPETTKCAASVAVNAGSVHNPPTLKGAMHFVEHLVFFNSAAYPEEGYFNRELAKAGGQSNAYTSRECTVYYFDATPEKLESIFDIFAHFFIDPLFEQEGVDREIVAVSNGKCSHVQRCL